MSNVHTVIIFTVHVNMPVEWLISIILMAKGKKIA